MTIISFTNLAVSLGTLYIVRRIYWEATSGTRRRALAKQNGCLPPKKRRTKDPIFGIDELTGNLKAYKEHRILEWWTQKLTDNDVHTIQMNTLGQNIFLTDDPENVKTLLATGFDVWSLGRERITQMSAYLGHGIFTNEGRAWKHSREMLRPCFERSQVANLSIMEKHTTRLIDLVPKDGTTVDLQPLFHELTLDVATEFLFGRSTDALLCRMQQDMEVEKFIEAFEYCQNPFSNDTNQNWGILALFLPDPKFKRCAKVIQDFADKIIDQELASRSAESDTKSTRYVFLDELFSVTQDRTVIRSELLNILLAGRDTTASLLSNLLWELPQHPEMFARLRREITEHVGDEIPTYQQLKDMKYLKALINESQRMYPIVPSNSREALQDTILPRGGGPDGASPMVVPKGSYVVYHSYSMHRRPDIYGPDSTIFNPDRWLDTSNPLRPGWGYIPFSGGPRVCIGQNFALTECMFVIVKLLQSLEIDGRDDEPWREKMGVTCVGLGGCKVGLKEFSS